MHEFLTEVPSTISSYYRFLGKCLLNKRRKEKQKFYVLFLYIKFLYMASFRYSKIKNEITLHFVSLETG